MTDTQSLYDKAIEARDTLHISVILDFLEGQGYKIIKDGEFKGTCASQNPFLNTEGKECGYCGKVVSPGADCKKA